jgi:hypothetical protein
MKIVLRDRKKTDFYDFDSFINKMNPTLIYHGSLQVLEA